MLIVRNIANIITHPIICFRRLLSQPISNAVANPTTTLELLELGSFAATVVILCGICVEIYLDWRDPARLFSDVAIGAGLIIEALAIILAIFVTRAEKAKSDREVAEATERAGHAIERAAEAHERAANAENEAADARERTAEIERLYGWRHVPPELIAHFATVFSGRGAALSILIEHWTGNDEAWSYSMELKNMFETIGVAPGKISTGARSFQEAVIFGLLVRVMPDSRLIFISEAFATSGLPIWRLSEEDALIIVPARGRAVHLYIFVGMRPRPKDAPNIAHSARETSI